MNDDERVGLRGTTQRMSRMRRTIATRMVESLRVSAQLTTVVEADVTELVALRREMADRVRETHGVRLTMLAFLSVAALDTLRRHPAINASIDDTSTSITYHDHESLAVAVETPGGLTVPVIHDAGALDLVAMAAAIADVAERARGASLRPEDLVGGTFTITNTGSRGALFDTPIVNQPQVAILGTGAIVERPVVRRPVGDPKYSIVPRFMMYLSLSYDHRLVDGSDAARYLGDLKELLETPGSSRLWAPGPTRVAGTPLSVD